MLVIVSNMQLWGCLKGSEYPHVFVLWCKVGKRGGRHFVLCSFRFWFSKRKMALRNVLRDQGCHRNITCSFGLFGVHGRYNIPRREFFFWGGSGGSCISSSPTRSVTVCVLMESVNEKYSKKLILHSQHYIPPAPHKNCLMRSGIHRVGAVTS